MPARSQLHHTPRVCRRGAVPPGPAPWLRASPFVPASPLQKASPSALRRFLRFSVSALQRVLSVKQSYLGKARCPPMRTWRCAPCAPPGASDLFIPSALFDKVYSFFAGKRKRTTGRYFCGRRRAKLRAESRANRQKNTRKNQCQKLRKSANFFRARPLDNIYRNNCRIKIRKAAILLHFFRFDFVR